MRAGRTLWRTHDRQPRASSMPQTTIYAAPRTREQTPPPAVATHQLARLFGRSAALAGVTMRVAAGRTIALLGPNGAGKTHPAADPGHQPAAILRSRGDRVDRHRCATGRRAPAGRLPVSRHRPVRRPDRRREPGLHRHHALRAGAAWAVDRVLAEVGLTADADRRVRSYSAGMRRGWPLAGCC